MQVTLMSFNVQRCINYVTREKDYEAIAEEIRRYNIDIIGLNEVCGDDSGTGSDDTGLFRLL